MKKFAGFLRKAGQVIKETANIVKAVATATAAVIAVIVAIGKLQKAGVAT